MWNNYTMVAEMLGSLFLVLGVILTIKASAAKAFNLTGVAKNVFVAFGVASSLMIAVYVSGLNIGKFAGHTYGFSNPAVALMEAVGNEGFNHILPAIAGEFIGGIVALLIILAVDALLHAERPEASNAKFAGEESFFGEVVGSSIFLGGVAVAVFAGNTGIAGFNLSGIIVGLSIFAAIALVGWRFALMLNPMVAFVLATRTAIYKKYSVADLQNNLVSLVGNLAIAGAIGAVYYGLAQM